MFLCLSLERLAVKIEARLKDIVTRELELLGFELVKLESSLSGRRKVIRLFIDRPGGAVSVDDCVRVSKVIGLVLDDEDLIETSYNLEVSSPGMNRPLSKPEHFRRFAGMSARVVYSFHGEGTKTVIGRIREATDEALILEAGGEERRIPFEMIEKANLHGEKWDIPNVKRLKENE